MGGADADALEGFSRTFLLAACLEARSPGAHLERYAAGLEAAARDAACSAWAAPERHAQALPEAATIAVALFETRDVVWARLDPRVRERVAGWLRRASRVQGPTNNWVLFPVLVHAVLEALGEAHDRAAVDRGLDLAAAMYAADGWYRDGFGEAFDHYTAWGFHLDLALWRRIAGEDGPRGALVEERLRTFLATFPACFGADGAPLHHGRSLIYRAAAVAPVWAGALIGATPLAPGLTRRLASGCARHFLEGAAVADGLLVPGWHGAHPPMVQAYSGPASSYFLSTAFLGLLLPADAPEWTEPEAPLPVESGDFRLALPGPGLLLWGTEADGVVRAVSHRSDHFPFVGARGDRHYDRVAYSTRTAPDLGPASSPDATVTGVLDGLPLTRERFRCAGVLPDRAASVEHPGEWARARGPLVRTPTGRRPLPVHLAPARRPPWVRPAPPLPRWVPAVRVLSLVHGACEVRIVHVVSLGGGHVASGGHAVAGATPPRTALLPNAARAESDGLHSVAVPLAGFSRVGTTAAEGVNAFGARSSAPFVLAPDVGGGEHVLAALHLLTGDAALAEAVYNAPPAVTVDGRRVEVRWGDGTTQSVEDVSAPTLCGPDRGAPGDGG